MIQRKNNTSLDEIDRQSFNASSTVFDETLQLITLEQLQKASIEESKTISLDGEWQLCCAEGKEYSEFNWDESIPAIVPGSIHTALHEAGKIPDPTIGTNQTIARQESYKAWAYRLSFSHSKKDKKKYRLEFDGICNKCSIWLNGKKLGAHEGMFGGPEYDVTDILQPENDLIVLLDAIPFQYEHTYPENNASWRNTVVINNVYGWHYSNMPSLGIWRSVRLVQIPEVEILNTFIATKSIEPAEMMFLAELQGSESGFHGTIYVEITPQNFEGKAYTFSCPVKTKQTDFTFKTAFLLPDAKLWWPVDMGEPNLYTIKVLFESEKKSVSIKQTNFGIRTLKMLPSPEGPNPELYNWIFEINGREMFVKGTGWCTADAMLDLSVERLERFIFLAREQHCQMLRAWGSGMPETDEFYNLCDEYGIMVMQEWPTAWNSHLTQPYDILEETVIRNTKRLRNHPSLVMWGAGNESNNPFGEAIDMMGRLSIELDGTRSFHRGEPWGGSDHNYTCYWGMEHLDFNLNMTSNFFGEFGLATIPNYESVLKYMCEKDLLKFPLSENGSFVYHTPIFGHREDVERLLQYAGYFIDENATLEEIIIGSQIAQSIGLRHPLERARTRWPNCSGALYYKMNDNFPAASWSTVDWYGSPKLAHYFCQDAFAPTAACILFKSVNSYGTHLKLPVHVLDDTDSLKGKNWHADVKVYDGCLNLIKSEKFDSIETSFPVKIGDMELSYEQTKTAPLFLVSDIVIDDELIHRNYYFINYEMEKGSLFSLPRASLICKVDNENKIVRVSNIGNVPSVCTQIINSKNSDKIVLSDNCFWLEAGETIETKTNITNDIWVKSWNSI